MLSINKVRGNYYFSVVASSVLLPIQRCFRYLAREIEKKVWVNGRRVNYDGIELTFGRNQGVGICSRVYWEGGNGYEPHTWQVLKSFITKATTFVDVGANLGLYSILAKKLSPALTVIAIEPVPEIFDWNVQFQNVNQLKLDQSLNVALGDSIGEADLFLPISNQYIEPESTGTLADNSWQKKKNHKSIRVDVVTLDSLLESNRASLKKLLIKIDVEDFEANVIKGSLNVINKYQPVLVIEMLVRDHGNQQSWKLLSAMDYAAFAITEAGLFRIEAEDLFKDRNFTDFLWLPRKLTPSSNFITFQDLLSISWAP